MSRKTGDTEAFDKSWQEHKEAYYTHWTRGDPQNQVQFAFRNHWIIFQELMKNVRFNKGKRCLEVGCGRGSISAYFSDAGFECTLLDSSESVLKIAKTIFKRNNLKAKYKIGDANNLPFDDNSFDVVVSIGLLEHFKDIEKPVKEQIRILDKGGLFLGYIVPKYTNNVQKDYTWINEILKGYVSESKKIKQPQKEDLFRTDYDSKIYIDIMKKYNMEDVQASGIYPVPMISHSIEFPFTIMPERSERALISYFKGILEEQRNKTGKKPWLCKEGYGHAFLVWGYKK